MSSKAVVSESSVLLRADDASGVTTLTLNRPAHYNALSDEMIDALSVALTEIGRDESVRAVILAADGPAFCAGHDLRQMQARRERTYYLELLDRCASMMRALIEIPQPVIARVHGIATAAGCQLVATCDLAVASDEARFAISGVNLGLFCCTPIVALSRNIPVKRALEMGMTGDFIDAATAAEWGLVNRAVPAAELDSAVAKLTAKITAKPAFAVATGKRLFYQQLEATRDEAYQMAARAMTDNLLHDDACDGIDAFLEKRPPSWKR